MKVKLALSVLGALVICFLPGCRDFAAEEYSQAKAGRAEAQAMVLELQRELQAERAKVAELESELEACQAEIADLETQLKERRAEITDLEIERQAYQADIAELKAELMRCQAQIAALEAELETSEPEIIATETEEPTALQEEDFRYRGFEGRLVSVQVATVNATWDGNKLTVTFELTNTCQRKIHLDLLQVEAHDQMLMKGESEAPVDPENPEAPLVIYPTLQDNEWAWPGETVRFDAVWIFGPLSKVITIEFSVVRTREDTFKYAVDDIIPSLTVTRPSS